MESRAMTPTAQHIIEDPCTSLWLKNALQCALSRDPVDALADAEILFFLLQNHCNAIYKAAYAAATEGR